MTIPSGRSQALFILTLFWLFHPALGRLRWTERNNRAIWLHPRRFDQQRPPVLDELSVACPSDVCDTLAGKAITPLLAGQNECAQQDMADEIINASRQFDDATRENLIAIAIKYRQTEKNTPPDYTTSPPTNRNSVFCQKAPQNNELYGLVQAQDPMNDPNTFFDPAAGKTIRKGMQPNTFPFGISGADRISLTPTLTVLAARTVRVRSHKQSPPAVRLQSAPDGACPTAVTVTYTGGGTPTGSAPVSAVTAMVTSPAGSIGNFGSCSVPQIAFGTGFDGRKETSFQPVDKVSYNHPSAQSIDIITQFICDALTNSCGADQIAKNTCATAQTNVDSVAAGTGGQADAFNEAFGIETDFASIPSVDDQGNVIPGTGSGNANSTVPDTPNLGSGTPAPSDAPSTNSQIGNFGSCAIPEIEFGTGFDSRKETSFQPANQTSYNHGSSPQIDAITGFICGQVNDACNADQTAKNTCVAAQNAANQKAAGTGAQADAFNAVFGIDTNFGAIPEIDSGGATVSSSGTSAAAGLAATNVVITSSNAAGASPAPSSGNSEASVNTGNFGSCSVPQIEFGAGFDGRKETSFQPTDKSSYNHGSAQNIDTILQFICDTLANSCGADQTAKNTCAAAQSAADGAAAGTGAQADAFNRVFGITTDFDDVAVVNDQGNVISGGSTPVPSGGNRASTSNASASVGGNLQTFTGSLGGVAAPAVTANGGGTFQVQGESSFQDLQSALSRSCNIQHNSCANVANSSGDKGALTVNACDQQQSQCTASAK